MPLSDYCVTCIFDHSNIFCLLFFLNTVYINWGGLFLLLGRKFMTVTSR